MKCFVPFREVWLNSILFLVWTSAEEISQQGVISDGTRPAATPTSRVLLTVTIKHIRSIPNLSELSTLECVVREYMNGIPKEHRGTTDSSEDGNPNDLVVKIQMDYHFETRQYIDFVLRDRRRLHPLGIAKSVLGRIVSGNSVELQLDVEMQHIVLSVETESLEKRIDRMKPYIIVNVESVRGAGEDPFLDYVIRGMRFHSIVGVDFADLGELHSGHYVHQPAWDDMTMLALNAYQRAINSVIPIVEDYNKQKMFMVLCFGGRLPESSVSGGDLFRVPIESEPLKEAYFVGGEGVEGALRGYSRCLSQILASGGPTKIAPIIRVAVKFNRTFESIDQDYLIALILIGDKIDDMQDTREIIESAESWMLPLSILVVGVGDQDFGSMEELNTYDGPIRFINLKEMHDVPTTERALARKILGVVPEHLVKYYKNSRRTGSTSYSP